MDPSCGRNLDGVFSGVTTSKASCLPKPLVVASLLLVFADGGLGGNLGGSRLEFLGGKFGFERLRPASPASTSCKGVGPPWGSTVMISSCLAEKSS